MTKISLVKSKTFWLGLIALAIASLCFYFKDVERGIEAAMFGLGCIFLRHSNAKIEDLIQIWSRGNERNKTKLSGSGSAGD